MSEDKTQETSTPVEAKEEVQQETKQENKQETKSFTQEQLDNIVQTRIMAERRKYEKKIEEENKQKADILKQKELEEAKTKQDLEKIMQDRIQEKDQEINKYKLGLKKEKIDIIFHAAAYKHVPLVEENICESVKNNVFGTFILAEAVINHNVSNFVLISSDKAVRSTNIMGATKRLAEICVQSIYDNQSKQSKFAIVRFGNVLQSSGSVIPKFKKQIKEGGPITLTHPDVTRYFMTTTEAAQLVIQAGAMGKSSEVFVLDMGESVKIKDLI